MDAPREFPGGSAQWWDRLDQLVEAAGALPEPERHAFLDRECGGDAMLRAEAASLLAHSEAGDSILSGVAASLFSNPVPVVGESSPFHEFVGGTVGHYRVESRLGSGGMGVVYRALDTRLGRPVALKFIWPELSADPARRKRLLSEARAAAALDHPNICTVHEVGETSDGALFIAMGYYEGETLKARLARNPLSVPEAVDAVRQVAEGVRAAHARGIVHRDIKPGNILVTREGVAKLLDFGVAKHGEVSLTGEDGVVGTTAYMSPEQYRGEAVDARSDIWALGVVAYELLASRRPFDGDTPARTMYAVLNEEPPPLVGARDDLPASLHAVVKRALAKDPAARPQSAGEFIRELDRAVAGIAGRRPAFPDGRRRSTAPGRHRSAILLGIALVLLGSSALTMRLTDTASADDASTRSTTPAGAPVGAVPSALASVAVLRFEDPAAEGQTWFTDGITEAIQAQLRQVEGLRVVGHFSALTLREVPPEETLFGSAPGGHYLLTGGVHRSADSIWVTSRLLAAATGMPLWEATYARRFTPLSLRDIPGEVAREAARTLALRFPPAPRATGVVPDPTTYQAYLEGRYHLRRFQSGLAMRREELDKSVLHLREVVDRSPSWPLGLAGLGEALAWVGMFEAEEGKLDAAFAEAKTMLERALLLDPNDARAHATLGYALHRNDLDFAASEAQFRRALEIDPDQYWHCGYAFFLLWSGRYDEAAQAFRHAEVQDPLYLVMKDFLVASYLCSGRYEEAIVTAEEVLAQLPQMAPVRRNLALALQASGRIDEAYARIDQATFPDHPYWKLLRALLHARSGRTQEAEALLVGLDEEALTNTMRAAFPSRHISPAPLYAAVLVALKRPEEAVRMLSAAVDRDRDVLLYDRCYSELEALERDARYRELLRRTGVPGYP